MGSITDRILEAVDLNQIFIDGRNIFDYKIMSKFSFDYNCI